MFKSVYYTVLKKTRLSILHLISATGRVAYATFAIYRTRRIKFWLAHICCVLYIAQHAESVITRVANIGSKASG